MSDFITIEQINERINKEHCAITEDSLSDSNLMNKFKETKSCKKKLVDLIEIFDKLEIDANKRTLFTNELIDHNMIIPAGTKGVIRGNKFNYLVRDKLKQIFRKIENSEDYDLAFEKNHPKFETGEIPDFYIYNKKSNKIIIGMNQIDLWNGGAQRNRANKYIMNSNLNTDNCKLLCVVCNYIKLINENKVYEIFNKGFKNNTLCYIKGMHKIIKNFFK